MNSKISQTTPKQFSIATTAVLLGLGVCVGTVPFPGMSQTVPEKAGRLLEPQSCGLERQFRSLNSNVSTHVQFINRSNLTVKVYWLDFAGRRQHYFDLSPDEVRWQQTYLTHPWIVVEAGANPRCLTIFLPTRARGLAILN
jgi:hypothetical protein